MLSGFFEILAIGSVVFERAFACGGCTRPSLSCLLLFLFLDSLM